MVRRLEFQTWSEEPEQRPPVDIGIPSEPERHQLLCEWNDTDAGSLLPDVLDLIEAQAQQSPDAIAVQCGDDRITYAQLLQRVDSLASYLGARGVVPDFLVGICLDRSLDLVVSLLGVLKAGGAYVPLDPAHPGDRLAYILKDSRVSLLLTESPFGVAPWMGDVERILVDRPLPASESRGLPVRPASLQHLGYVIYTSGSTGKPKGVQVTRGALGNFLHSMQRRPGLAPDECLLAVTTPSFDIAALELYLPLIVGARVVLARREEAADGSRLAALLARSGATVMQATPAMWRLLLEDEESAPDSLRVLCGGEALGRDLAGRLFERFGSLWNLYGPTETTVWSCLDHMAAAEHLPTIGRPICNTQVYILDRFGNPVPAGVAGELCIAGRGLARGYLHRPQLTAEKFIPCAFGSEPGARLYRTGDLAQWRLDGNLEYLGRIDQQVKIRGFRIEPGEVESELRRYPRVRSAVVVAREVGTGEKRLVAYYVATGGPEPAVDELRDFLGRTLPEYMVPSLYVRLDALPLTPNGKVDRGALPVPDALRPILGSAYAVPSGALELRLTEIWSELLEVDRVGSGDDFFALGGDSIRGALFINRLQKELGEPLYITSLFEARTPALYAEYLRLHYASAVIRRFPGEAELCTTARDDDGDGPEIGRAEVVFLASYVARRHGVRAPAAAAPRNPPAVFILSPPRAGSTLLRVMLAGHPRLFSPPEPNLLSWETLAERSAALAGRDSFGSEGLVRTIMEIERCDAATALERVRALEAQGATTQETYRYLQDRIGNRLLVDKTPSYALDPETLRRAERLFEGAFYIHLARHPRASIRSYVEARMDRVYGLPFPPRQQAELVWLVSHDNIAEFLSLVPPERQMLLRFEDLVQDPHAAMERVRGLLGIEFAPEMLRPYEGERMTDGLHAASRMMGDPRFHEHQDIDASMARKWTEEAEDPLSELTWRRAESLGYRQPTRRRAAVPERRMESPVPVAREHPLPLSFAQERLWLIDRLLPGSSAYNVSLPLRLAGDLDVCALRRSLGEVLRRHEVLRTTFRAGADGQPLQVIAPPDELELPYVDLAGCADGAEEARRLSQGEARLCFDLERGPLVRAALVRLSACEHLLLLTVHHIVCDGWSRGLIVRELCALYAAFAAGRPSPLPEPPVQYADFAVWQRAWLTGEVLETQLRYWREALAGLASMELTADLPRPAVPSFRGSERELRLAAELAGILRSFGRDRGATWFMVLLSLFQVLLHRYTGEVNFAIGTPIANRNRTEIEGLIGFFANTLVLRADLSGQPGFLDLVDRVRETALRAYVHQDLPFERLVEELQPERDLSRNPLFQVAFVLQGSAAPLVRLPGLAVHLLEAEQRTAKFDITLLVEEDERGLVARIEYGTDLFHGTTVSRLLEHFRNLAEGVAGRPELPLGELPLLSAPERQQVVREWNDTAVALRGRSVLHGAFEAQADRTPECLAVEEEGESLTYRELEFRANQLAHRLRRLGVGPELAVGLCLERSPDLLVGLLAILKAGGIYLPVDPALPSQRRTYLLRDAGARVLLTRPALLEAWNGLPGDLVVVGPDAAQESPQRLAAREVGLQPGHLAYLFYTSGSTGEPKGVAVEHGAACEHMETMRRELGLGPADRVLQFSSASFDVSLEQIFPALASGATLVLRGEELWSPAELLTKLARLEITVADLPTAYLQQCVGEWSGSSQGALPPRLRLVSTGGEALSSEVPPLWDALRGNARLLNVYGPTEAVVTATLFQVPPDSSRRGESASVLIGLPLAGRSAYVLDRSGNSLPVGVPGELCLGGQLARGYAGRPRLTAERFVPDPWSGEPGARLYRTGDLVRWRREGVLEFLRRIDHQIKIRGFRVEPGEIEAALCRHPAVRQAVVVLREDAAGEPRLVAYLEVGGQLPQAAELRAFAQAELPGYMVPSAFVTLESFQLTPSGKVDRQVLRALAPQAEREDAGAAPRSPVEEVVAGIWCELLGLDRIGVQENFFTLGGHSLKATQLVSWLSRIFNVELPASAVFQAPTVAALSELLFAEPSRRSRIEQAAELWLEVAGLSDDDLGERLQSEEVSP